MSAIRPWYQDYINEYGIYNEIGDLVGISDEVPPEVKKAFDEDMARERKEREEAWERGGLIS